MWTSRRLAEESRDGFDLVVEALFRALHQIRFLSKVLDDELAPATAVERVANAIEIEAINWVDEKPLENDGVLE